MPESEDAPTADEEPRRARGADDPPSLGGDFRSEFNTDAKIAAVIRSGSVIGKAPMVSMRHWAESCPTGRSRS